MKLIRLVNGDGSLHGWAFECRGCGRNHHVTTGWSFNGDTSAPTFSPSILVKGVEDITDDEHKRIMAGETIEPRPYVCHSFVRDGRIEFLSDSTHALAGQTVELPEIA